MKKIIFSVLLASLLIFSISSSFAQTTTSTSQDFAKLQQQKNQNSGSLSYAVFYITENDKCSDTEYKSLKFYQVVAQEYLALYHVQADLQGSLCVPEKSYQQYFSGLSTFTLPIVISDNTVGQKLVQQGFYGMYEITGTGMQAIYVCSCDTQIESWAGAWVLSHEISHFALRYFGEPDAIAVNWVHYIQSLVNQCQNGDFSKVCPQYSTSVPAPSGNLIPVMEVYGQGPSSDLPPNAPQSEASTLASSKIIQVSNPTCQNNQICVLPGDYVKYQITTDTQNQTVQFSFVNPTDDKNIAVKTTVVQNGTTTSESDIVDLSKSLFTRPSGQVSNFMYILPTPLKLNSAYQQEIMQFNNYQRNIMSGQNNNQTNSILVQIDQDTGILVQLAISHVLNTNGKISVSQMSYKLLDTNKITTSNVANNSTLIPSWIKQNAKFWSDGSIPDDQFLQGIQYMINQGIMIPQANSGINSASKIPSWVKNDAKFWSEGFISDDEFVKSIQYLVTNGMINLQSSQEKSANLENSSVFPKGKAKIEDILLDVEIADSPQRRTQGLQYHTPLSYSQGMLFEFTSPQVIQIWMKSMQFPIDIIWFDSAGNVLHVEKNVPPCSASCPIYDGGSKQAQFVLEVASGFVDKFGISPNSHLVIMQNS